jgi:hypothetical protein
MANESGNLIELVSPKRRKQIFSGCCGSATTGRRPFIVNLQPQQANVPEIPPADLRFSQTGFGIKLQLDLTISKNVDVSLVERELLRGDFARNDLSKATTDHCRSSNRLAKIVCLRYIGFTYFIRYLDVRVALTL